MKKPTLGITMGDAAGIGPEIIARLMIDHADLRERARLVVIGDFDAMRRGAEHAGVDAHPVRRVDDVSQITNEPGTIEVLQIGKSLVHVPMGEIHPDTGEGAYRFIVEACTLAKEGKIHGIITGPVNKTAMHAAGHRYPGHAELLAQQFDVDNFSSVLSAGDLYVFHLTTQVSLRQAIEGITRERVGNVINLASAFSRALGWPDEAIAVAGLNPRAGENRLFGDEDADILAPEVEKAREMGLNVHGPLPGEGVIPEAFKGVWNLLIVCYHDQGYAPFKAVFGDDGIIVTVGLPVVPVSVAHGSAFDIAGKGIAREASLVLAVERAADLSMGWGEVWQAAKERN